MATAAGGIAFWPPEMAEIGEWHELCIKSAEARPMRSGRRLEIDDVTKLLPGRDYFRDNVMLRNDTILGVCEAIGTDLGFNPNFLRVPLAAGIIFSPVIVVSLYFALGVLVFATRTFLADRRAPADSAAAPASAEASARVADNGMDLPRAA